VRGPCVAQLSAYCYAVKLGACEPKFYSNFFVSGYLKYGYYLEELIYFCIFYLSFNFYLLH
jgi:hypothetical protein